MGAPVAQGVMKTINSNVIGSGLKLKSSIDYEVLGISEEEAEKIETKIEKEFSVEEIFEIIQEYIPSSLPVAKTQEVGHAKDSKALKLGEKIYIKNELIV